MGTIEGSKDPNNRFVRPNYHQYYSIWALKPYYLGPWTLRAWYRYTIITYMGSEGQERCMHLLPATVRGGRLCIVTCGSESSTSLLKELANAVNTKIPARPSNMPGYVFS